MRSSGQKPAQVDGGNTAATFHGHRVTTAITLCCIATMAVGCIYEPVPTVMCNGGGQPIKIDYAPALTEPDLEVFRKRVHLTVLSSIRDSSCGPPTYFRSGQTQPTMWDKLQIRIVEFSSPPTFSQPKPEIAVMAAATTAGPCLHCRVKFATDITFPGASTAVSLGDALVVDLFYGRITYDRENVNAPILFRITTESAAANIRSFWLGPEYINPRDYEKNYFPPWVPPDPVT